MLHLGISESEQTYLIELLYVANVSGVNVEGPKLKAPNFYKTCRKNVAP
jgi:hypothetical protein